MIAYKTNIQRLLFTIFITVALISNTFSQKKITGTIVDKQTRLSIPFASVVFQVHSLQKGVVSDVYGRFEIMDIDIQSLTVSCLGYEQKRVILSENVDQSNLLVELKPKAFEINEVVVTRKNNPAIRVIQKVLVNRKQNNFDNYENYSYSCYLKTIVDAKLMDNATKNDSLKIRNSKQLKKRTPFISECVFKCLKLNNRTENKIIAQHTSGFKDPLLIQSFVSVFHHSISFYNNSVALFEQSISDDKSMDEYVSPLTNGCLACYNFELEDMYNNNADSVFVINYWPKKGQKFNGLKGKIFINSNGYAIQNIVAEPSEKTLVGFKFRQDYMFVNGRWFPTYLYEEIGWVPKKNKMKTNVYPVYLITSRIDSLEYSPNKHQQKINFEKVYVDKTSIAQSEKILNLNRRDTLTLRERNTYIFMDSIGKKYNLDYYSSILPKLMVGKIPVKCFDVNLNSLYSGNKYEGSRIGIGLNTNNLLSKNFSVGGFVGYGFKDEKLKYGGQIIFNLNKYRDVQIKLSYSNDLKEIGLNTQMNFNNISLSEYMRTYMGSRYDNIIQKKLELGLRPFRFMKLTTALSLNELRPCFAYSFNGTNVTHLVADELQITAQYAYNEIIQTIGEERYVNFSGNPIFNVTYTKGLSLFNEKSYRYNKIEASIDYKAYDGRIGQSNFKLAAGFIDRTLPYSLLFTGEGSKNSDFSLIINNSFQTMKPYEFLSDKYINLFYSHNFGSLLINSGRFKPQFILVQNTGWGKLNNPSNQGVDFRTKDNVYLESGLIINNLIRFKYINLFYLNLGVGGFYRYGYYKFDKLTDNLALKLSVTVSLK